jgi:hypothetical protein
MFIHFQPAVRPVPAVPEHKSEDIDHADSAEQLPGI